MFLYGITDEDNFPELWCLLAALGQHDRLAINQAIHATAECKGITNRWLIETPFLLTRLHT
jgi:hypothetical protein